MNALKHFALYLRITGSRTIARRYFVVNGFDGALAMLGIITGFYANGGAELQVIISACLGATIALGMSGISSAYISESAERKQELKALEDAMVSDLQQSVHGRAARLIPLWIGLVNGLAPLLIALVIMLPLWLARGTDHSPLDALGTSICVTLLIIFLLGVFLGRISATFWLWAGLRALLLALLTGGTILLLTPT
jgi:predicted membrane protein (TIGR00267 family)